MKKVKIQGKLSLDKMTVAKLNDNKTKSIAGGGFLSIGKDCTIKMDKCGGDCSPTRGIWCKR